MLYGLAIAERKRYLGGWWTRPKNWITNTIIAGLGIGLITYNVFKVSARNEVRTTLSWDFITRLIDLCSGDTFNPIDPYLRCRFVNVCQ